MKRKFKTNHHSIVIDTPELADACRKSLIARSNEGTGWSIAWKTNLWAMLGDGEQAFNTIKTQMKYCKPGTKLTTAKEGGTYPNLFDAHPPFQIDGNFGATAGIAEMLLQSTLDRIVLLPALPTAWKSGSMKGLRAKGGATVDLTWQDGELTSCQMRAEVSLATKVRYGDEVREISLQAGEVWNW